MDVRGLKQRENFLIADLHPWGIRDLALIQVIKKLPFCHSLVLHVFRSCPPPCPLIFLKFFLKDMPHKFYRVHSASYLPHLCFLGIHPHTPCTPPTKIKKKKGKGKRKSFLKNTENKICGCCESYVLLFAQLRSGIQSTKTFQKLKGITSKAQKFQLTEIYLIRL